MGVLQIFVYFLNLYYLTSEDWDSSSNGQISSGWLSGLASRGVQMFEVNINGCTCMYCECIELNYSF